MSKINFYGIVTLVFLMLIAVPSISHASPRIYLNDSTTYSINLGSPNQTLPLNRNLTLSDNINHTFEAKANSAGNFDVEYISSNTSGFLLRFRIDDEADILNDILQQVDCVNTATTSTICDNGCGGNNFAQFHNFTVIFNPINLTSKLFIDGISRADLSVCSNATLIGSVKYSRSTGSTNIKNNLLLASNNPPALTSNLLNITWQEDTSASFNISGNFSDLNNDTLTYGIASNVENITVTINSTTGIVNLTPSPNFFGIRYATFLANDSDNITFSNNVTLNVTNVNDMPTVSNIILNNTDFLNRTNGSLDVGWIFSDIDGDSMQSNETLWYINGTENASLRNLTIISQSNTSKTQNWTASVRVFDGANFSSFVNSTSLTIQNSAPTQSAPLISSSDWQSRKNGTLSCSNQSTADLDDDSVTNSIRWYKNNVLVDAAASSTTLNPGNYSKNDNLSCEITPSDGTSGAALNSTVFTISNAAPLLNATIQNKTWDAGSTAEINLSAVFIDIDGDNLTYNFTPVPNIAVSISNNTAIATLTPDNNFDGVRSILFFASDGTNSSPSNNVTLTVNALPAPSPSPSFGSGGSGSGGGAGGGSGSGNYLCEFNWECSRWSECENSNQQRRCKLVKVQPYQLQKKCPQFVIPEQSRNCAAQASNNGMAKENCDDKIQNQNEEGIDCGGACPTCLNSGQKNETQAHAPLMAAEQAMPAGYAITSLPKIANAYLLAIAILLLSALLFYAKFFHKRLFGKDESSEEEIKRKL